jgi:uncharacterized repeat protein (TIGR03803 family)
MKAHIALVKKAGMVFLLCVAAAIAAPAQTFTTLFNFDSTDTGGPYVGLVQGQDGNFYGTTEGEIFKITPQGVRTILYTFCSETDCADGNDSEGALVLATDGNFYGTTMHGGVNAQYCGSQGTGCGTVFRITPQGEFKSLHAFVETDGAFPEAGLVQASDGNLYGVAQEGGEGYGTAFKISMGGDFTLLHVFCSVDNGNGCVDGAGPLGALMQGSDGLLYGTTEIGGINCGTGGNCGTFYSMSSTGTVTTLYNFCALQNCEDGDMPDGAVIQGPDGNFYGTTPAGGTHCVSGVGGGCGTVFKITPTGTLTTVYDFCELKHCVDGTGPDGTLILASDGNFYGAFTGGAVGEFDCTPDFPEPCGSLFRLTPEGKDTILYRFDGNDGAFPTSGFYQATDGTLYGTTYGGGSGLKGTVFTVSANLPAFVATAPTVGKTGVTVSILGNGLTGTSSVTFNGTAATFTVVSDTEISTTVPSGATTGKIAVTTPSGTLKSNVAFQVRK